MSIYSPDLRQNKMLIGFWNIHQAVSIMYMLLLLSTPTLALPMIHRCVNGDAPSANALNFCTDYNYLSCCSKEIDARLKEKYDSLRPLLDMLVPTSSSTCRQSLKSLLCLHCSPQPQKTLVHVSLNLLLNAGNGQAPEPSASPKVHAPGLCLLYCANLLSVCPANVLLTSINFNNFQNITSDSEHSIDVRVCRYLVPKDSNICFPERITANHSTLFPPDFGKPRFQNDESLPYVKLKYVKKLNHVSPLLRVHALKYCKHFFTVKDKSKIIIYNNCMTKSYFVDLLKITLTFGENKGILNLASSGMFYSKNYAYKNNVRNYKQNIKGTYFFGLADQGTIDSGLNNEVEIRDIAIHPNYENNCRFFVFYVTKEFNKIIGRVSEFTCFVSEMFSEDSDGESFVKDDKTHIHADKHMEIETVEASQNAMQQQHNRFDNNYNATNDDAFLEKNYTKSVNTMNEEFSRTTKTFIGSSKKFDLPGSEGTHVNSNEEIISVRHSNNLEMYQDELADDDMHHTKTVSSVFYENLENTKISKKTMLDDPFVEISSVEGSGSDQVEKEIQSNNNNTNNFRNIDNTRPKNESIIDSSKVEGSGNEIDVEEGSGENILKERKENERHSALQKLRLQESDRVLIEVTLSSAEISGSIVFDADGYLNVVFGSSAKDDIHTNGKRKLQSYLGKVTRVDVDCISREKPYCIPESNPFVSGVLKDENTSMPVLPETFAMGIRKPRFCALHSIGKEKSKSRLLCNDLHSSILEINEIMPKANYGGSAWEGHKCLNLKLCNLNYPDTETTFPVKEVDTEMGEAGIVFLQGESIPEVFQGVYMLVDITNGILKVSDVDNFAREMEPLRIYNADGSTDDKNANENKITNVLKNTSSVHSDNEGEVYLLSNSSDGGIIYQVSLSTEK